MLAAWIAAGSTGLLAGPLRVTLTYLAITLALVLSWPRQQRHRWLLVGLLVVAAIPLVSATGPLHELLVVSAAVAMMALWSCGIRRTVLQVTAQAVLVLAVFRFAWTSISTVWLTADAVGGVLGGLAGWLGGKPLSVGATFGGVDFLVLNGALFAGWLAATEKPRLSRAVTTGIVIVLGHVVYLLIIARALDLSALLPTPPPPSGDHPYVPPDWHWASDVAPLLPWNLPALGAVVHLVLACGMLRWARWAPEPQPVEGCDIVSLCPTGRRLVIAVGVSVLAALLPFAAALSLGSSDLSGRKIVANAAGHLDWERPQYDRYGQQSAGMFGMLPMLIRSLGGQLVASSELSEKDLADADLLLLVHPVGQIPEPRRQRVLDYVRRGGALLVLAEPHFQDGPVRSAFNDLLSSTTMRVRDDVAVSVTGGWQDALVSLSHPINCGLDVRRSSLFTDAGSSLRIAWPARPLIAGRWGWSDPGNDAVQTGVYRFEAGERLGDLVLAAEQRVGSGTIAVLGNSYSLTNEGLVRGYGLTGRLLAYLADRRSSPQALWRQAVSLALCIGLLVALAKKPAPEHFVSVSLAVAISLAACEAASRQATRVVPDGRVANDSILGTPGNLAYIDASHVEAFSDENWVFDGINGLALTLMRNGYLTVRLPELTRERLERAAILVSIGPAREFTSRERAAVYEFVKGGGIFICTVGAEEASPSARLLADFGLRVPVSPVPTVGTWREPEPIGHLRSLYLDAQKHGRGDYKAGVTFYAGWPVEAEVSNVDVLVRGAREEPLVVARQVGRGQVVVIGDTAFALNKNLEYIGGDPFEEGGYENAHFWRWLISRVTARPEWIPPPSTPQPAASASQEEQE